jgi:hypothetical protein
VGESRSVAIGWEDRSAGFHRLPAVGTAGLLCVGPIPTFLYSMIANVLVMRRCPTVRTQRGVVPVASQHPVQHFLHVDPNVEVVPHGTADQRQQVGDPLARRHAADEQPILAIMPISALTELCEVQDYANHAMPLGESGWAFAPQPGAFVWLNFA